MNLVVSVALLLKLIFLPTGKTRFENKLEEQAKGKSNSITNFPESKTFLETDHKETQWRNLRQYKQKVY